MKHKFRLIAKKLFGVRLNLIAFNGKGTYIYVYCMFNRAMGFGSFYAKACLAKMIFCFIFSKRPVSALSDVPHEVLVMVEV